MLEMNGGRNEGLAFNAEAEDPGEVGGSLRKGRGRLRGKAKMEPSSR